MPLPDPTPIIIARPLFYAMLDRLMLPYDLLVSPPLIGIERGFARRVVVDMGQQGFLVGVFDDPQPYLSGAPAHDAPDYRRTVIVLASVPAPLVGAPSGRIFGVRVPITFFPPRYSGTSRRSLYAHPLEAYLVEAFGRFAVAPCATRVRLRGLRPTPRPISWPILPCSPLARARPPVRGANVSSRRACRSRDCRCPHTEDSGRR